MGNFSLRVLSWLGWEADDSSDNSLGTSTTTSQPDEDYETNAMDEEADENSSGTSTTSSQPDEYNERNTIGAEAVEPFIGTNTMNRQSDENDENDEPNATKRHGPLVMFARFEDGNFLTFRARTRQTKYIAISHVWGTIEWRWLPFIGQEARISEQKAAFVAKKLPGLVGSTSFWMDTLTVDQRDTDEIERTVDAIPCIFRDAIKTIAIREGDAFVGCCAKAIENSQDQNNFRKALHEHAMDVHYKHTYRESYLLRLWTLQECLLSNTIQFVTGVHSGPCEDPDWDPYSASLRISSVFDSLFVLGQSFQSQAGWPGTIFDFMKAYVTDGTISRPELSPRTLQEDIYTNGFHAFHSASNREATEPRDYIFATMPQFDWYKYPKDAKNLAFTPIFLDFHRQAVDTNHAFSCRITRSMTTPHEFLRVDEAWLPSNSQPEPACLGDFLKLLGHRLLTSNDNDNYHVTTTIQVTQLVDINMTLTFEIIEESMRFSARIWAECFRGGELSKYGCIPSYQPRIQGLLENLYSADQVELEQKMTPAKIQQLRADWESQLQKEQEKREQDDWLLPQAFKILSLMWCAVDKNTKSEALESDWECLRTKELDSMWTQKLQQTILLLAAMINCQVPLSAFHWARQQFFPVSAKFTNYLLLALVSKHASKLGKASDAQDMHCAGRHKSGAGFGRDLVISDQVLKIPVGLLPDFLHGAEDWQKDEGVLDKLRALYRGQHLV